METNDLEYFKQKIYEIAKVPKSRLEKNSKTFIVRVGKFRFRDETNMPLPGMKVRDLVSYSTLVSIQQTRIDGDGLKHYVGLIKEDNGKSSNGQIYDF